MKKKKILIVGGTGFLGFHLCKFFIKKNWKVLSLSLRPPVVSRKLNKVKYFYGDISNIDKIFFLNKISIDFIINCGGYVDHYKKQQTFNSHVNGCKNLVKIFSKKKIKLFVQLGSSTEYGLVSSPQSEKQNEKPTGNYGQIKLLCTNFLKELSFFFPYVIIRPYQVYGPFQDNNRIVPYIINSCLSNKKFPCTQGIQHRDFLYIEDFNRALYLILLKKQKCINQIINIGYGKPIKIKNLILKIKNYIKKGHPEFGKISMRKDEQKKVYPSIKKALKLLNWRPKVSLEKGLLKTISYYKKNKLIKY